MLKLYSFISVSILALVGLLDMAFKSGWNSNDFTFKVFSEARADVPKPTSSTASTYDVQDKSSTSVAPSSTSSSNQASITNQAQGTSTPAAGSTPTVVTATSSSTIYPLGISPIAVGPLELIPSKSVVTLFRSGDSTCYKAVLRVKVGNNSAADVKAVFISGIEVTDDLGHSLYHSPYQANIKGSGIPVVSVGESFNKYAETNKSSLPIISPKQSIDVQFVSLDENQWPCLPDKEGEQFKTLKPKTYNMSGQIGIVNVEDKTEIRSFSISEAPFELRK